VALTVKVTEPPSLTVAALEVSVKVWPVVGGVVVPPPIAVDLSAVLKLDPIPAVVTAAAVVVGGLVMVLDPIFQGLAVALMSGAIVATLLTMVVVPLLYWQLNRSNTHV
jgi:hypothetical protein